MKRLSLALCTLAALSANAYDITNHYDMANVAAFRSVLETDPELLPRLGLRSVDDQFPATTIGSDGREALNRGCRHGQSLSILRLIACGAAFEDIPATRVLNHFFDPINDRKLYVRLPPLVGPLVPAPFSEKSPDWALGQNGVSQDFSWSMARQSFWNALVTPGTKADRDKEWGRTFQTLGQVVHHLQDMAQPQHVRNDQHLSLPIPGYANPSFYETFTASDEAKQLVTQIVNGTAAGDVAYPAMAATLRTPRDFWTNTASTGIAQYTNLNFVSLGTNFRIRSGQVAANAEYPDPRPVNRSDVPVQQLVPPVTSQEVLDYCATGPACTMSFYSTNDGTPNHNERASAQSIFDQYVNLRPVQYESPLGPYLVDRIFTVNKYTFVYGYPLLLPHAVGYSAGLINYFFRGKLEIGLPSEGVYSVYDYSTSASTGGFRTLRVRVSNLTPGKDPQGNPITEAMTEGAAPLFVAIAKFRRNLCYQLDFTGELGVKTRSQADAEACRSTTEEIRVSQPAPVPTGINQAARDVTFTFDPPIPVSATDVRLQVAYRGPLGDEPDAVMVASKDISEPTYFGYYDLIEQFKYGVVTNLVTFKVFYCDWANPPIAYDDCKKQHKRSAWVRFAPPPATFDPQNGPATFQPTLSFIDMWVSTYAVTAVLGDTLPLNVWMLFSTDPGNVITGTYETAKVQKDVDANPTTIIPWFDQARGIWVNQYVYSSLDQGDAPRPFPPFDPLTPLAVQVAFPNAPPAP